MKTSKVKKSDKQNNNIIEEQQSSPKSLLSCGVLTRFQKKRLSSINANNESGITSISPKRSSKSQQSITKRSKRTPKKSEMSNSTINETHLDSELLSSAKCQGRKTKRSVKSKISDDTINSCSQVADISFSTNRKEESIHEDFDLEECHSVELQVKQCNDNFPSDIDEGNKITKLSKVSNPKELCYENYFDNSMEVENIKKSPKKRKVSEYAKVERIMHMEQSSDSEDANEDKYQCKIKKRKTQSSILEKLSDLENDVDMLQSNTELIKQKKKKKRSAEFDKSNNEVEECLLDSKAKKKNKINQKEVKSAGQNKTQQTLNPNPLEEINSSETKHLINNYKRLSLSSSKKQIQKEIKSESSDSDSDAESRKAIRESAEKRIIQNISTSESESRKFVRPLTKSVNEEESSDSDSAPESMSFSTGRQLEMDSLKNVVENIQRDKQRQKEKRRQRLEKYKQQKEEKLIRLKEKRASQEDASCSSSEESGYEEDTSFYRSSKKQNVNREKENVDDEPDIKIKRNKETKKKEINFIPEQIGNLKKLPDDILNDMPDQIPAKHKDKKIVERREENHSKNESMIEKKQEFRSITDIDYIPLRTCGATEFSVMPLDVMMKVPMTLAERAAEFRQNMLYGSHIKRVSGNYKIMIQHKLKSSGTRKIVNSKMPSLHK